MPGLGWLLNAVYAALLVVVSPWLVYRRVRLGKHRRGWPEKLTGRLTRQHPERECVWIHAVSVGEVLQIELLVRDLASDPRREVVITTTTETGYDTARSKYPFATVTWFPFDFTWAVRHAIASLRPSLIALVELEIWPNFVLAASRAGVPLVIVNGRLGAKSHRGYRRIRPVMRALLSRFHWLGVQNEAYRERFIDLGAPAERVTVTGNIKFDRAQLARDNPATTDLRSAFQLSRDDMVLIAGSTQDPEELLAVRAWRSLVAEFPRLRLVLVPRHKERFEEVAAMVVSEGLPLIRRSHSATPIDTGSIPAVRLLDTLGELQACWGLADVAFVGGSLTRRGGQNMLEPAGYGIPVLFGPNTWNFQRESDALLECGAAEVITDEATLREAVRRLLSDSELRARRGAAARQFVASQQGATARTLTAIGAILNANEMARAAA
ncbi:MAG: 3-deoxy-D-manno-octulosonic acid transferase [Planctomycetaceae bacterium]|nr:3-deoxy-D-manno-octulosonic acid transferase [Planctomycetaceae bacterium]